MWFDRLTPLHYGWGPGQVELDPCTENQDPPGDSSWSCGPGVEGFFIIAKSRSGNYFYLRKLIGGDGGIDQLCAYAGYGGCRADGTW